MCLAYYTFQVLSYFFFFVILVYVNGPDESLSEKDWTDEKHPAAIAYVKSKKLAEKAAWDYQKGLNGERMPRSVMTI